MFFTNYDYNKWYLCISLQYPSENYDVYILNIELTIL